MSGHATYETRRECDTPKYETKNIYMYIYIYMLRSFSEIRHIVIHLKKKTHIK